MSADVKGWPQPPEPRTFSSMADYLAAVQAVEGITLFSVLDDGRMVGLSPSKNHVGCWDAELVDLRGNTAENLKRPLKRESISLAFQLFGVQMPTEWIHYDSNICAHTRIGS